MDKKALQTYATWSKQYLEQQIELSLKSLGIHGDDDIREAKRLGDVTVISGDSVSYPAELYGKRERIVSDIKENGYRNVIEEFAYTWFNRFVALRFMEVHGFLSHGFRVLSNPAGGIEPEILKNLGFVKGELNLDIALCEEFKQQGKIEELFRYVLTKQCNALSDQLPMLFSSDMGYLDLLLPQSLLKGDTVITRLVEIPEEAFLDEIEIIGWMYQFYISSKKDAVFASKKTITKDTLPAVTQLFTPDWIVRYMAENSVGRIWLESYPGSSLRSEMKYYVEDAEQTPEVQRKLDEIKYKSVNPEDIKIIEPCCGSGHILVYVFDLLFKMYEERGYQKREIPTLILRNNITGLDVDKRASQLASFSLVMKARSINNRFFDAEYYVKPHVYEIKDSQFLVKLDYRKQIHDLNLLSLEERELIHYIVGTFEYGKTIGSLLKVNPIDFDMLNKAIEKLEKQAVSNIFNYIFLERGIKRLRELSQLGKILSSKYDVMITNPPYINPATLESAVKVYSAKNYPDSKTDMFAMFMETGFVKANGFTAMINMHGWMFISSFENLRLSLLTSKDVISMAHLGARAFETIGGEVVQTTTFVMRSQNISGFKGKYFRLVGATSQKEKETMFLSGNQTYVCDKDSFRKIPGAPFAYWASKKTIDSFNNNPIEHYAYGRQGMTTTDNAKYLRLWHEVNIKKIGFGMTCREESIKSLCKWFPHNKGGQYRKWYGNNEYVVYYLNDGQELIELVKKKYPRISDPEFIIKNRNCYFKKGIEWSDLTTGYFGARIVEGGYIFDATSPTLFLTDETYMTYILGLMNSIVFQKYMDILSPTLHYNICNVVQVPVIFVDGCVDNLVQENINLSKEDWDSFETSWDFKYHPLMLTPDERMEASHSQWSEDRLQKLSIISWHYEHWKSECDYRFNQLKKNEEELNRFFINTYGLQDELMPEITDECVSLRKADLQRDIKSFLSYLVGIVMGRYSVDVPGLAYAGGEWDESKYHSYQPDDDGIVPIYVGVGMEDGLTARLSELVKLIYGEESFKENIDFIAESLGKTNNESSMETINRYLNDGFYADHLKIYQKRPIYWLFSSGKLKGFKCLVYMHRYNKDTLARVNAKYYLPESTRQKIALEELEDQIKTADGKERIRLEKNRQKLFDKYNETIEYGQVLDHMANKYIDIDLDDGVKVNYAKFQGVELVSDSGVKIKKDLLVPLK